MTRIFIKPTLGATIIDPETGNFVPPEGCEVADSKYIRRRIADGDAFVTEAPGKKSK